MDILMITLVPVGAMLLVLIGFATVWKSDSPDSTAWAAAAAVEAFVAIMTGWLLYRFGWGSMSWLLIAACIILPLATFAVTKAIRSLQAAIFKEAPPVEEAFSSNNLRAAAPLLIPFVVILVIACGAYLFRTLR